MKNSIKFGLLCVLSFNFVANATAMPTDFKDVPSANNDGKNFYLKLIGEVAWPKKATFDKDDAGYLLLSGGSTTPHNTTSPGIGIGYVLPDYNNMSIELSYKRYAATYEQRVEGSNNLYSVTRVESASNVGEISGIYSFHAYEYLTPYISVGVGLTSNKNNVDMGVYKLLPTTTTASTKSIGAIDTHYYYNPSFSAGLGAETALTSRAKVGLGYHYQNLGKIQTGDTLITEPVQGGYLTPGQYNAHKLGTIQMHSVALYLKYVF